MIGWQVLGQSVASAMVGFLVWALLRRGMERHDTDVAALRQDVAMLRDRRIVQLEQSTDDRLARSAEGRKELHVAIEQVRREYVRREDCKADKDSIMQQLAGYLEATTRLERVSERADAAMRRSEDVLNRVIEVKGELAELAGMIRAGAKGRTA